MNYIYALSNTLYWNIVCTRIKGTGMSSHADSLESRAISQADIKAFLSMSVNYLEKSKTWGIMWCMLGLCIAAGRLILGGITSDHGAPERTPGNNGCSSSSHDVHAPTRSYGVFSCQRRWHPWPEESPSNCREKCFRKSSIMAATLYWHFGSHEDLRRSSDVFIRHALILCWPDHSFTRVSCWEPV